MAIFNIHDSAGVFGNLVDESQYTLSVSDTKIGIVGVADKGPVGVPTLIQSQKQFIDTFSVPSLEGFGGLAAYNTLGQTNQIYFTRIASDAAAAATGNLASPAAAAVITGNEFARYSFGFSQSNEDFLIAINKKSTVSIGFVEGTYDTAETVIILQSFFVGDALVEKTTSGTLGNIKITSLTTGTGSQIKIPASTAATTLGFATTTVTGVDATAATITSSTGGTWLANTFSSTDILAVKFEGDANKEVILTGSYIDGVDNVVDLVAQFNGFAASNVNSSLATVATVSSEKIKFTSTTTGITSIVEITSTTPKVRTALGFAVSGDIDYGTDATAATLTNTLKQGYNLSSSTELDFRVDLVNKSVVFHTSGNAAYSVLEYASGVIIPLATTIGVDDWTLTMASVAAVDATAKTADVEVGTDSVDCFTNIVSTINTNISDNLTATHVYDGATLSGTVTLTANDTGTAGNVLIFNTSNVTAYFTSKDPTDETLGYGNGSVISDLTQTTIENAVLEINRQTGGIYAYEYNGKIKLASSTTGTTSTMEITAPNTALGFVSGDVDAGELISTLVEVSAISTGKWGEVITVKTEASDSISVYDGTLLVEKWTGNTINASANYIETVVNTNSNYITISYTGAVGATIPTGLTTSTLADGDSGALVTDNDVVAAINLYNDTETMDINMFSAPGFSSTAVLTKLNTIGNLRQDMLIIVDPPVGYTPANIILWHDGISGSGNTLALDNKYMALYWPWIRTSDASNGVTRLCPPSVLMVELLAKNDTNSNQWAAPAGVSNGKLQKAISVEYNADLDERDALYSNTLTNNINPIINILGRGIVVWGQKSLQRELTALNRVNVVRLTAYIRKKVKQIAMDLVFQPNDPITWSTFTTRVRSLLSTIQANRGISGFSVKMDAALNPPETIAQGKLFGRILFKPTIVAEQIELTYTVVGQDFNFS